MVVSFDDFSPGPKDMLDAVAAAFTVRVSADGRGSEVGGGDGLGTIVLPRPLTDLEKISAVHHWPDRRHGTPDPLPRPGSSR